MFKLNRRRQYDLEFNNAILYILEKFENRSAAHKLTTEAYKVYKAIKENPRRYPPVPGQSDMNVRRARVGNYVIVYEVEGEDDGQVFLTHFFHSSQNWLAGNGEV